ncbi:MAG: hypothetical protein RL685_1631 [Pseudomonadota bacterium]|jgi:serine/threonine-protein kinase
MFEPISRGVVADRYQLIEEIGRGGMGVVWRARHLNLGSDCAVKFIHASHAHDAELRQRFMREARAAARLQTPHSVHVMDVNEWQGSLFIAMELLSGESLEARLEREGRLNPWLTLEIVTQVARGLDEAHAAQVVHRDLKPENIFLVKEPPLLVKIVDFGIAKQMDNTSGLQTALGTLLGTPAYMSPEQADGGKPIDYRSDLWTLSVVAFRCLTGSNVFDAEGLGKLLMQVLKGPIPAPSSRNPSLSPAVDSWWFSVLQRDPALRPASASELAAGLRRALASAPPARDAEAPLRATPTRVARAKQVTLAPMSARGRAPARPAMPGLFAGSVAFAVLGGLALLWALGRVVLAPAAPVRAVAAPAASVRAVTAPAMPAVPAAPAPVAREPASVQPALPPAAIKASPTIRFLGSDSPTRSAPASGPASEKPAPAPSPPPQPAESDRQLGF